MTKTNEHPHSFHMRSPPSPPGTGVKGCESSSSTSHLLEEQQDRSSDSVDDLFDQTAKDSSLFLWLKTM